MKILPLLTGTLLQEAFAADLPPPDPTACDDKAAIVEVTCHEDLMVQLKVNKYCLKKRFPAVKVTDLKIGKTGEGTQCTACTDAQPQSKTRTDPEYCDPEEKFFAYDILFDPEPDAPGYGAVISSDPPPAFQNLWFKVGYCGSQSMTIEDDKAVFQTTLYKPPTVDPTTQIVSQKTVLPADITCKYPLTIPGLIMDPGADILIDNISPDKVVDPNADVQDIGTNVFDLKVFDESTGKVIKPEDKVSVGDRVKISVSAKDAAITDYFLVKCTATALLLNKDLSLGLIEAGCMVDLGNPLQSQIDAKSPNPGDYISFNQFGFIDSSSAETKLTFLLTCNIKLGIAPTDADCSPLKAGRKRRQTTDEEIEFTQTTEYTIQLNDTMALDTYGDIVVAHVGEGKLDGKSGKDGQAGQEGGKSDAITNAVALMAGTAIILL